MENNRLERCLQKYMEIIILDDSIENLPEKAFDNYTSLEYITLPSLMNSLPM